MEGYLFYANQVSKELYLKHRDSGHYHKGLKTEFSSSDLNERLIQHICVGLVTGLEKLGHPESLVNLAMKEASARDLLSFNYFFNHREGPIPKSYKKHLVSVWASVTQIALAKSKHTPEYKRVLSNGIRLLPLVDSLDEETFQLARHAIMHAGEEFNYLLVPEYLNTHIERSPRLVAELFVEMVRAKCFPDHEKELVKAIVEKIYEAGLKPLGNEICNAYFANNIEFLRPIFEKYNKD